MRLHHVGIATKSIDKAINFLRNTYDIRHVSEIIYDERQEANLCMISLSDGSKIELISGKVVENIIKKRVNIYHACYEVENLDFEKDKFLNSGAIIVSDKKPAVLFGGGTSVFFINSDRINRIIGKD